MEVEFTTQDCDPLGSGITSYGSANGVTAQTIHSCSRSTWITMFLAGRTQENGAPGDAYGAEVTYLPLAKLDDNAADDAGKQEGDTKRVPCRH